MIQPPQYVASLQGYIPGKPVEEVERELGIKDSVKLASNENPCGPSPKAVRAIRQAELDLNRYPESNGFYLTRKLSEIHGVGEDQIILGNGSNELINIAAYTYLTNSDSAVMATPSFVIYPLATCSTGARALQVPLKDYRHDLRRMAEAIEEETKIVFIANPNNPTGTINREEEFSEFIESVPENLLLVVDEAYFEYVQDGDYPDSIKHLKEGRDLLILRTFSKIHGLAGLRIGYGLSKKEIITELNKVRAPFNTNSVAQLAALKSLEDQEHVRRSLSINEEGKTFFYDELTKLDVEFVPSEANFVYIMLKDTSSNDVFDRLMKKGVIIRPMGEKAIRVTIGLQEENRKFMQFFKEVI